MLQPHCFVSVALRCESAIYLRAFSLTLACTYPHVPTHPQRTYFPLPPSPRLPTWVFDLDSNITSSKNPPLTLQISSVSCNWLWQYSINWQYPIIVSHKSWLNNSKYVLKQWYNFMRNSRLLSAYYTLEKSRNLSGKSSTLKKISEIILSKINAALISVDWMFFSSTYDMPAINKRCKHCTGETQTSRENIKKQTNKKYYNIMS